ncbi:hypothetical protein K438DRAFT_754940 [Mycena galopus ATCC 62051]|nr:hypothetical protein K438DRAFT_754940 [Mycena galopus ATCC 62051]
MAETSNTLASGAPPAKRQRVEEEQLTRSDSTTMAALLSKWSPRYSASTGPFSVCIRPFSRYARPQPVGLPSSEGCPVVELDDSLEDVKHLLDVLYNPHIFNQEKLSFPFIAALVRLGRKYDFKNLLEAAVQPTSFI